MELSASFHPCAHTSTPVHLEKSTAQVKVKSRMDWNFGTYHNVEVPSAGEFARASRPLEASIKITPTVVLTNSLPYFMEVGKGSVC